jgi:hypothetical protein
VLIVIVSGLDTFSDRNLDQIRKKIQSTNVTVYGGSGRLSIPRDYQAYVAPPK